MQKRALISVYHKDGILELARFLTGTKTADAGSNAGNNADSIVAWEILSTGGTAAYLRENGIPVTDVSSVTGFPECLDGRVKTLHPAIHAGLLARRDDPAHLKTLSALNLAPIDLVAVNLYPFFEKAGKLPFAETVEFIDIGGPSMLRSAAKNFAAVTVLTDAADYPAVIEAMRRGDVPAETRRRLAAKVFNLTSAYDAAIAAFLFDDDAASPLVSPPAYWAMSLELPHADRFPPLRYGENPHQKAAFYLSAGKKGALGAMEQLAGKALGYNNIRDLDLAWKAAASFNDFRDSRGLCAAVAVKHVSPCGIALGGTPLDAFKKARDADPVSIFGGVVALNMPVDGETAREMAALFLEIVAAPDFTDDALTVLRGRKDLRIMRAPLPPADTVEMISVDGGLLVQECDTAPDAAWDVVTRLRPAPEDEDDLRFAMRAVAWMRSNAIVVAKDLATAGIGSGETNRVSAAALALQRAASGGITGGSTARVLASDAFFPFADTVEAAAAAGIKSIIQPGGSIHDKDSIEACDRLGLAMVFTGTRRFKH